jgi:hypothetical protein
VQLQHPEKVEGEDYRIPSSARFREWRRFLVPIFHYLSLPVLKLAEKLRARYDSTIKLGIFVFQTALRCELKDKVTTEKDHHRQRSPQVRHCAVGQGGGGG